MFSGVSRQSGMRVNSDFSTAFDDLFRRIVGVDRHHLGAVDHDVGDVKLAEAKNILDVFGLADLHLAMLGRSSTSPSISTSVRISCSGFSLMPSIRRIDRDAASSNQFSG